MEGFIPETKEEEKACEHWKKIGAEHFQPSPTTLKIVSKIDKSLGVMTEQVRGVQDEMKKQHKENREDHKKIDENGRLTNGKVADLDRVQIEMEAKESVKQKYYGILFSTILMIGLPMVGFTIKDYFDSRKSDIEQRLETMYIKEAIEENSERNALTAKEVADIKKNLKNGIIIEEIK